MNIKTTSKEKCIKELDAARKSLSCAQNYIWAHDKSGSKKVRAILETINKLESQLR